MTLATLLGIALSASSGVATNDVPLHRAVVQHGNVAMHVDYRAASTIRTRNINLMPANRSGTGGCRWDAYIQIQRSVSPANGGAAVAGLARAVDAPTHISGVVPGMCAAASGTIENNVAARVARLKGSVDGIARADQVALAGELASLRAL
ncbi:hypothetical protein BH10PSE12_BH10PSE12_21170 [soil metagenome]